MTNEIGKCGLTRQPGRMTNEALAMEIQAGNTELYEPLWEQTKPLLKQLAWRYYTGRKLPVGFDFEDCLQYGFIALCRSVQAYDPAKQYKLTAYLWNQLRNVIGDELHIRNGKQPIKTYSYNVPLDDSEEIELIDTIADEEASEAFDRVELTDTQRVVRAAIEGLPEDQGRVITLLYYNGMARQQAARALWVTEKEVASLREKAIRSLRKDHHLRELYREHCRHWYHNETPVDFYFSDAYRQATETIRTMQNEKYISYGKMKTVLYLAEQAFTAAFQREPDINRISFRLDLPGQKHCRSVPCRSRPSVFLPIARLAVSASGSARLAITASAGILAQNCK